MKKCTITALVGLALIASTSANAKGLSYNYVEGNYLNSKFDIVDGFDLSAKGFGIGGSVAFGDTGLYGIAAYETIGEDFAGELDADVERITAGAGYALELDKDLHFIIEAAYLDYDFSLSDGVDTFDAGANGYRASVGVRSMLDENIEGLAKVGYQKVEEQGVELYDGAVGELGIRWKMDAAWSVGLHAEIAQDETTYKAGIRAQW
jgi:hypothetical protein